MLQNLNNNKQSEKVPSQRSKSSDGEEAYDDYANIGSATSPDQPVRTQVDTRTRLLEQDGGLPDFLAKSQVTTDYSGQNN